MRIVVTGGAGFNGSALSRHLVMECGHSVLALDTCDGTAGAPRLAPIACNPRFTFRKADVCDRRRIGALLAAFEPDAVIHMARKSDHSGSGPGDFIRTNVVGTFGLLEAVRDYWSHLSDARKERFRLVQVSSADVFGAAHGGATEGAGVVYQPGSPCAGSMAAADQLVMAWQRCFGLPAMIAAPVETYGPYQRPERRTAASIIAAITDGTSTPEEDTRQQHLELLHVEDFARAVEAMLRKGLPGAVYPVGGGAVRPELDIERRIGLLVERHGARSREGSGLANKLAEAGAAASETLTAIDCSRLTRDTGWRTESSLESGLSRTVRWYLDNESWWRSIADARNEGIRQGLLMHA